MKLRCRECGRSCEMAVYPRGCPACASGDGLGLLEVTHEYDGEAKRGLQWAFERPAWRSVWRFACLLPPPSSDARRLTLGEGGTPLLEADWLSHLAPVGSVYLKNDTVNPTWCSKDRGNAVSVSVGLALGACGMVAVTTGNHGASVAAYSARAQVPAIALCSPHSDVVHRAMIAMYGGTAIVSGNREAILRYLVRDCGWFPCTSMSDHDAPNPYGVEGFKTLAYEIYEDLRGAPDAVFVPTASGDLLFGIHKGFRELMELGFTSSCPRVIGCQAAGAAPLAAAFQNALERVPVLPNPTTVAVSIGDATSGRNALAAVRESGGDVVVVSDEQILNAQRLLAANGLLAEAASAAAVAALTAASRARAASRRERVVCVLTGAGAKWSSQLASVAMNRVLIEPQLRAVTALVRKTAPR